MLIIRFQRVGKKNQPSFRVVLTEKHRGPQKKYLEELGFYNPRQKIVQLKSERIFYWLSKGVQVSPSCYNLFVKERVISGSKIKKGKITASSIEIPTVAVDIETNMAPVEKTEEKNETESENKSKESRSKENT